MSSPISYPVVVDDKDLDDAALWAVIDSATASHSLSKSKTIATTLKHPNHRHHHSPYLVSKPSPPSPSPGKFPRVSRDSGEVVQEPWTYRPPRKVARIAPAETSESTSPLALVRSVQRTPSTTVYSSPESHLSPEIGKFAVVEVSGCTEVSPRCFGRNEEVEKDNSMRHSLSGGFPSVSLFKEYQNTAMAVML